MRFIAITTFAVTGRLVALAIATPIPNWSWKADGIAIPLARHPSSLTSNETINLDAVSSHAISVRDKILRGLDNYEMNTGTKHPFAVKRSESGLGKRGTGVLLTTTPRRNDIWMGEISIGTPPKTLSVHIDTGAADMWVLQTGCYGVSSDRDLWDSHLSKTSEYFIGPAFRLTYDDGTIIQGNRYIDNVTIAGFTADPQTFGSISSYISPIQDNGYVDGLLGLAFPSISRFGVKPLFESLVGQNRLTNPVFSMKLSHSGAELYIGGVNSKLYNGDITYARITTSGYWQVSMDDVSVYGRKIIEKISVIFDTGSHFIFGDWGRVLEVCKSFGGTLTERGPLGYCESPCDSFRTVVFTFGGTPFEISPQVLNVGPIARGSPKCFGAIIADRSYATDGYWVLGLAFLQGIYTVFDYGNLQLGIAKLA